MPAAMKIRGLATVQAGVRRPQMTDLLTPSGCARSAGLQEVHDAELVRKNR
jgi:hypothetical protein